MQLPKVGQGGHTCLLHSRPVGSCVKHTPRQGTPAPTPPGSLPSSLPLQCPHQCQDTTAPSLPSANLRVGSLRVLGQVLALYRTRQDALDGLMAFLAPTSIPVSLSFLHLGPGHEWLLQVPKCSVLSCPMHCTQSTLTRSFLRNSELHSVLQGEAGGWLPLESPPWCTLAVQLTSLLQCRVAGTEYCAECLLCPEAA